jgi:RNA-binding motif protein, X-linked 2
MNTIREIEKINEQELERGIAGTPASWHAQYANSAWCYVGNLDHALTEGDVICIMSQFGEIDDIHLVREEDTGKSRGFGFVKYEDARSCVLAVDNLIGSQILGRSLRIDHVEHYRLPKKLQEQEEEKGKNQRLGEAGHAYEGVELENQYNVKQGVDLFAPVSQNEKGVDEPGSGTEDEKEAKRRRKEERQRKREEKEERRRRKEEKRERKEEKKRKKRARELEHDDNNSDDDGTSSTNHHRRERKHKSSKKRRHSKER